MDEAQFHRYRIELISRWPDGPHKDSALAAALAAMKRHLEQTRILAKPWWER